MRNLHLWCFLSFSWGESCLALDSDSTPLSDMARAEPEPVTGFLGEPGGVSLCPPPDDEDEEGCGEGGATFPG